jgi:co-chaperonin GroES (HSP10)
MNIKPLWNQVLFRIIKADRTEGGLHLPESAKMERGCKVVEIGDDVKRVKKGDTIIFKSKELANVKDDNGDLTDLYLLPETDIIAIKK